MDFEFTKEQIMFQDMAREFVKREMTHEMIVEYDRKEKDNPALRKKLGEAGFLGMLFPKEYDGLELDYRTATTVIEELGKGHYELASSVGAIALCGTPIIIAGTEEQKQKYIPWLSGGEKVFCVAANEANAGSDGSAIETTATLEGDEWVINGTKTFIAAAGVADVIELFAQTDKSLGMKGQAIFIVETKTPGVFVNKIDHMLGQRGASQANLRFVDCRIPKENMMGEMGKGLRLALSGITDMRWAIAAATVGMAQDCLDRCVSYVQTRKQFGKPIGSFQLIQSTLADMAIEIEAARHFTYHLAYLKDKKLPHRKETSMAKLYATEMGMRVTAKAVRIHGAYATTDDLPLEERYRTSILPTIYGGTSEMHRMFIGRELTGLDAIT
ncbi:acyl-CoA dehydrogenase family protein [Chloroflexota bacterium]